MADELSPSDRSSLAAERGAVNMAVGAALVFEAGPGLSYDAIVRRLEERLHLIPRYRQRLYEPPLGVTSAVWVDDEHFDIRWHVRHSTLPAPGTHVELEAFLGRELSRRLDRSRPLWELHVLDGLAGDRGALLPKMHHALVDGVAAVDVGMVLLDPTPEPMTVPSPDAPWTPERFDRGRHLTRLGATPFVRGQRLLLETAGQALDMSPRRAAEELRSATDLVAELARARPQAPMTPLNVAISPNRRFATARAGLAGLKAVGKAAGATVNDALLAVVAGAMSRYFDAAGLPDPSAPVALVPVSVRREDEHGELGNRISTVFVDLPVHEPDPIARVRTLGDQMRALKDSAAVRAGALLVAATGWTPPAVSSLMVRATGSRRAFNVVVSNVPGPQQAFYLAGCRLLEVYPAVPLNPANQGLSIGILSYDGRVFFGLLADGGLDPPLPVMAEALRESLDELLGAAPAAG
jgi:diacylglycerol O-acyltransferase